MIDHRPKAPAYSRSEVSTKENAMSLQRILLAQLGWGEYLDDLVEDGIVSTVVALCKLPSDGLRSKFIGRQWTGYAYVTHISDSYIRSTSVPRGNRLNLILYLTVMRRGNDGQEERKCS